MFFSFFLITADASRHDGDNDIAVLDVWVRFAPFWKKSEWQRWWKKQQKQHGEWRTPTMEIMIIERERHPICIMSQKIFVYVDTPALLVFSFSGLLLYHLSMAIMIMAILRIMITQQSSREHLRFDGGSSTSTSPLSPHHRCLLSMLADSNSADDDASGTNQKGKKTKGRRGKKKLSNTTS